MIKVQSPTRVDLAGGTLDCWPLYLLVGDCQTVNLSINVFTSVELTPVPGDEIEIRSADLDKKFHFPNQQRLLADDDPAISLIQKVVEFFNPPTGFELTTHSESPVGGGLGGSSSLCISLIKAFGKWLQREFPVDETVRLASHLEAKVLQSPTGTQDYYPALTHGLGIIHYTALGPRHERVNVNIDELGEHLLLIYTGRSHHSGINNWQVIKSVVEGDQAVLKTLKDIAAISARTADVCRQGKWGDIPELFRHEFDTRIRLTPSFTSPEIEALRKLVLRHGAEAVKICGAGGGGCVLVWARPENHEQVKSAALKNGFQPIPMAPVGMTTG